jgi:3-hydroxyisobutyrate dehydrogenase
MRVGFIGLGTMGASMALNARTKGKYDLVVHDLRREAAKPHLEAGCAWADSPAAVAKDADIILTSLPGPRDVEAVAEGLIQTMRR